MGIAILGVCGTTVCRAQQINGSSLSNFESSVVALQNTLSLPRRADFEAALALIWIKNTTINAGDLDHDGDSDSADIRRLMEVALNVQTEIERGNIVSVIERRNENAGDYAAKDYLADLNGLGYEDVLALAGQSVEAQQAAPLAGTWFGTLKPPEIRGSRELSARNRPLELRARLEFSVAGDGTYRGSMVSINQGDALAPMTEIESLGSPRPSPDNRLQRTVMGKVPRHEGQRAAAGPGRYAA